MELKSLLGLTFFLGLGKKIRTELSNVFIALAKHVLPCFFMILQISYKQDFFLRAIRRSRFCGIIGLKLAKNMTYIFHVKVLYHYQNVCILFVFCWQTLDRTTTNTK